MQCSRRNLSGPGYIYVILRDRDQAVKLGASIDPFARVRQIRISQQDPAIHLLAMVRVQSMSKRECILHRALKNFRAVGHQREGREWFDIPLSEGYLALEIVGQTKTIEFVVG